MENSNENIHTLHQTTMADEMCSARASNFDPGPFAHLLPKKTQTSVAAACYQVFCGPPMVYFEPSSEQCCDFSIWPHAHQKRVPLASFILHIELYQRFLSHKVICFVFPCWELGCGSSISPEISLKYLTSTCFGGPRDLYCPMNEKWSNADVLHNHGCSSAKENRHSLHSN